MVSGEDPASWLSAQKMPRLLVEIECRAAKPRMADYHHLRYILIFLLGEEGGVRGHSLASYWGHLYRGGRGNFLSL